MLLTHGQRSKKKSSTPSSRFPPKGTGVASFQRQDNEPIQPAASVGGTSSSSNTSSSSYTNSSDHDLFGSREALDDELYGSREANNDGLDHVYKDRQKQAESLHYVRRKHKQNGTVKVYDSKKDYYESLKSMAKNRK